MKLRIQKWLDEVNYTQFVKVCSVTKVALGRDELLTCNVHGYPHHVIIIIIIIIIFLLIIITITTRWAVVPLWLGLSLPTVESAFSQGLRAILILKKIITKFKIQNPNPDIKTSLELRKLPFTSFNVRSVCPVCPMCPECPVSPDDHDDHADHDDRDDNDNYDDHD